MKTIFKPATPQHQGNSLRRLIGLLKIAPKELAAATAYSQQMIAHYLQAEIIPPHALHKIATALRIAPTAITQPDLLNQIESIILQLLRPKNEAQEL